MRCRRRAVDPDRASPRRRRTRTPAIRSSPRRSPRPCTGSRGVGSRSGSAAASTPCSAPTACPPITTAQMEDFVGLHATHVEGRGHLRPRRPGRLVPDPAPRQQLRRGHPAGPRGVRSQHVGPGRAGVRHGRAPHVLHRRDGRAGGRARCATAAEQAGRDPGAVRIWSCYATVPDTISHDLVLKKTVGRLATYLQGYGDLLVSTNGWDPAPLAAFRADPVVTSVPGAIDNLADTAQLEHIATLLPDEWLEPAAIGDASSLRRPGPAPVRPRRRRRDHARGHAGGAAPGHGGVPQDPSGRSVRRTGREPGSSGSRFLSDVLHPAAHAVTAPDRLAVVAPGGRTLTYAQLDDRSNRVANLLWSKRPPPRRSPRDPAREPGRVPRGRVGRDADGAVRHARSTGTSPPDEARLHRRRLRGHRAGGVGRPGPDARPARRIGHARRAAVRRRRAGAVDGFDDYEAALAEPAVRPGRGRVRGLRGCSTRRGRRAGRRGSSRRATGGPLGAPTGVRRPGRRVCTGSARARCTCRRRRSTTPRPPGWTNAVHRLGGTAVVMDRFDPLADARADRAAPRHPRAVRADPPGAAAQAARGRAQPVRPVEPPGGRARRRAVPARGEARRARLARPDRARVLLGQRGRRLLRHRSRRVAGPPGFGREVAARHRSTSSTPDGTELAPGEVGQVWFESPTTFEYHGDPEKTASAFDEHGWSSLGDMGRVDDDGYLYLTDRVTNMIISGGVNIYPREIEDVLIAHPAVADVAVVGVPDPEMGEAVRAVVQLGRPGGGRRRRGSSRS